MMISSLIDGKKWNLDDYMKNKHFKSRNVT